MPTLLFDRATEGTLRPHGIAALPDVPTSFAMEALVISENTLLKLYMEHLPTVRAAAEDAD